MALRAVQILALVLFPPLFVMNVEATPVTPPQSPVPWSHRAPEVTIGRIERLEDFHSKFVDSRPIDVWLPPDYSVSKRYAVLYMQDGQMLFDGSKTWNKTAWNVQGALSKLMAQGLVRETIIVGIPSNGKYRYSEYYPDKLLALAPTAIREDYQRRAQWGFTLADRYLNFLVEELKPAIDKRFATQSDRENTFVMGSSMGGLISLYALCEYPQVFGGAAAMSTHWVGRPSAWGYPDQLEEKVQNTELPVAAFNYLQGHLPPPRNHRIYMDRGNTGLDRLYGVHQGVVDRMLSERGYTTAHFSSRVFEGAGHSEVDWASRVDIPLLFLLGLPSKAGS